MALNKRNKGILYVLLGIVIIFGIILIFTPSPPTPYKMILINDTNTDLMVGHDDSGNTMITIKPGTQP